MNWHLFLAFKYLFPTKKFGTAFTWLAIIGVALGVAVLLIVLSVMNGFQSNIKQKIVDSNGEIRIESTTGNLQYENLAKILDTHKEIAAYSPYTLAPFMLISNDGIPAFAFAKGINSQTETRVTNFDTIPTLSSIDLLGDDEIILDENLCKSLHLQIGDSVELYSTNMLSELTKDSLLLPRDVVVVGIFRSQTYNTNGILMSNDLLQDLYNLDGQFHGVTIKVADGIDIESFAQKLQHELGADYRVIDWKNLHKELLFALQWEKTMMFFVLLFIVLIAAFSISCTLITNVVRKTKEIALINAIGGSRIGIMLCFCYQSLLIGTFGTILGLLSGVGILHYRDNIMSIIEKLTFSTSSSGYISQFIHLPVLYTANDILLISLVSIVICALAGIIPAIKTSKINPALALRFEQ